LRPAQANSLQDSISKITRAKWTGDVAQAIGRLLCNQKALSPNPSTTKNSFFKIMFDYLASIQLSYHCLFLLMLLKFVCCPRFPVMQSAKAENFISFFSNQVFHVLIVLCFLELLRHNNACTLYYHFFLLKYL
jgi:hypothetical protein